MSVIKHKTCYLQHLQLDPRKKHGKIKTLCYKYDQLVKTKCSEQQFLELISSFGKLTTDKLKKEGSESHTWIKPNKSGAYISHNASNSIYVSDHHCRTKKRVCFHQQRAAPHRQVIKSEWRYDSVWLIMERLVKQCLLPEPSLNYSKGCLATVHPNRRRHWPVWEKISAST